jgi:hypothetical protein
VSGDESQVSGWDKAGARVRLEGAWLRDAGLSPTLFCGGGWYTDSDVAEACAELGYVDCTPRASRPPYLAEGEPWAALSVPARIRTHSGNLLRAVPTTHSLGDLARASRRRRLGPLTHVYFHDTDLLSRKRTALIRLLLPLLGRRARATDLDRLAADMDDAPEKSWADVSRL